MAQDNGINLAQVTGTGPGGRITKEDVLSFLKAGPAAAEPVQAAPAPAAAIQPAVQPAPQPAGAASLRGAEPVEMTRMQATIARRMTESRFSAPDFVLTAEIDMTDARALLRGFKDVEGAPKIGPNDLLIRAVASALKQHPEMNSGWENSTIVKYNRVNVGVAVAIPGGLVVPVIKDADQKSMGTIARESKGLIEKARDGKLQPSDYEGGTFTVSNLGMYGIQQFTPVINTPEACIMGVGSIVAKPVVQDGEVVVRERMTVTMACDHRVVNGSIGAEFIQTLRRLLENPMLAVL
jgi:pyruvate dehydrogenase E2 component (dihydrolipoamide acetyltransferase)